MQGHELQLKLSTKAVDTDGAGKPQKKRKLRGKGGGKDSTKILVRNLAFESTKRDLRELFSSFGQLKSVRIPRKFDGSNRGFGFVEFLTHEEAAAAMEALAR